MRLIHSIQFNSIFLTISWNWQEIMWRIVNWFMIWVGDYKLRLIYLKWLRNQWSKSVDYVIWWFVSHEYVWWYFVYEYADDVAPIITARSTELAQLMLNQVMRFVNGWMNNHRLSLAVPKTEMVILTKRRSPTIIPMGVETRISWCSRQQST